MVELEKVAKFWDGTLKGLMKQISEHPEVDGASKYYIGKAIFYVEHDLADGCNPALRIMQVAGCLQDEGFYKAVYGNRNPEAVGLLKELGLKAQEMLDLCGDD